MSYDKKGFIVLVPVVDGYLLPGGDFSNRFHGADYSESENASCLVTFENTHLLRKGIT